MENDGRLYRITRNGIFDLDEHGFALEDEPRKLNIYESARQSAIADVFGYQSTLIRVFIGGCGHQKEPFELAMEIFKHQSKSDCHEYVVEYRCNDDYRNRGDPVGPEDVVEWLSGGHFYFILSHAHQGRNAVYFLSFL